MDCSTLEALFRKLGSLEDVPKGKLGGKMGVVIDLVTRLPLEIWVKTQGKKNTPILTLRLVEIRSKNQWHSYLTSVIDPTILPPYVVADELSLPFDSISLEMIYRGLYHFTVAYTKGQTDDPVKYFAAPENNNLGIVKQKRKLNIKLIIAPFPDRQKGQEHFFFETPLTSCFPA